MKPNRERERRAGPWASGFGARARLHRAVGAVVTSSLEALAERLPMPGAKGAPDAAERTRTVLAIDRSTRAQATPKTRTAVEPAIAPASTIARPPTPTPTPTPTPIAHAGADDVCDEPIRTRSMARLLAKQGHPKRALAILEYLLTQNGADADLRAEAEAVRAQIEAAP
jgi:hypothetical protein